MIKGPKKVKYRRCGSTILSSVLSTYQTMGYTNKNIDIKSTIAKVLIPVLMCKCHVITLVPKNIPINKEINNPYQ
jgi:hypothetical protein